MILVKRIADKKIFFVGVKDFETQCFLEARFENKELPICVSSISVKDGEEYEILVGSDQDSRKAVT